MITFITEVFVFLQAPTFFLSLLDLISFLSFFRLIVFILTQVFAINSQSSNQENILRLSTEIHLLTLNVERNETPPIVRNALDTNYLIQNVTTTSGVCYGILARIFGCISACLLVLCFGKQIELVCAFISNNY